MLFNSADYEAIDPRYGTLEDWDRLMDGIHARGMKLMYVQFSTPAHICADLTWVKLVPSMDLVVNHTSDEVGSRALFA